MEQTIWGTLGLFEQIEHLIFAGVLALPFLAIVGAVLIAAASEALAWITDGEQRLEMHTSFFSWLNRRTDSVPFVVTLIVWFVFGTSLGGSFLDVLHDPNSYDANYDFQPGAFVWSFVKFIVLAYFLRYAYRIVKWVRRMAKVAHKHIDGAVEPVDTQEPTFRGDK